MVSLLTKKYFGPRSFYKEAISLALPVMMQELVLSLVSLVDNFMVAGLGDIKMSGVSVVGQLIFVFIILVNTICASGGIYMTQYFGAKNKEGMRQSLCFKIVLSFLAIALFYFVCLVIPRQSINVLLIGNKDANLIIAEGEKYLKIITYVGIPLVISTIISSSLRELGNVKPPLYISISATLINVFFNYLLIYGHFGAPRLEVRGAAIATVIARLFEMFALIIYIKINKQPFAIKFKDLLNIDWQLFKKMIVNAGMIIFSEMLWAISETVTAALYNGKGGADVVSGMECSFSIANLYFISFSGITTATGVIIGKTLGENKLDEARKQKTWLFSGSIVFGFIMMLVALLTILLVPIVFGNLSLSAQDICKGMLFYLALFMPLWIYQNTQFALSRAGGDAKMGFYVDAIFTLGVYFPLLFYLALCTDIGPIGLYAITKLTDIPKVIFADWWLKKERWVKNLAIE